MKSIFQKYPVKCFLVISCTAILSINMGQAQICPQPVTTTITSFTNTYYPGLQATVNAGSTSVDIAAAAYGTPPVSRVPDGRNSTFNQNRLHAGMGNWLFIITN